MQKAIRTDKVANTWSDSI